MRTNLSVATHRASHVEVVRIVDAKALEMTVSTP